MRKRHAHTSSCSDYYSRLLLATEHYEQEVYRTVIRSAL